MEYRDLQITITDNQNYFNYDITKSLDSVTISQYRKGQATKFEASFHNKRNIYIPKGSEVMVKISGGNDLKEGEQEDFFKGYVFEDEVDMWNDTKLIAYDQLNYLFKNQASYNINGSATSILKRIAADFNLQIETDPRYIEETGYVIGNGNNVHINETLGDIILHAINHTLVNTRYLYNLRDRAGKLTIQSPSNMVAKYELKTGSNILDFSYKGTINQKTYNKVKLVYSNEYGMDVVGQQAEDKTTQAKWGILQYYSKIDELASSSSVAGAQNMAKTMLAAFNREFRRIHIKALGDSTCFAGSMVFVDLGTTPISGSIIKGYQLVDNVTHNFENNKYTMDLDILDIDTLYHN